MVTASLLPLNNYKLFGFAQWALLFFKSFEVGIDPQNSFKGSKFEKN